MSLATPSNSGVGPLFRESQRRIAALLIMITLLLASGMPNANAGPRPTNISITPIINKLSVQNGHLVASGAAITIINGDKYVAPFKTAANLSLAADQSAATAAGCPILDLSLAPIHLNLLGLDVLTSPICLTITAYQGGGLLGDLLCGVANLLNNGLNLNQILAGLTHAQLTQLLSGLTNLLNAALGQLVNAVLSGINTAPPNGCAILDLALGPVDLTLLGLNVHLDNCSNGPVTVDITAIPGAGNLLGNLLCGLLGNNPLALLGLSLGQILGLLQGLLGA